MNGVDLVILVLLLIGVVSGLARGFVRCLLGLAGLALAIVLAAAHHARIAEMFLGFVPGDRGPGIVAFVLIFVVVVIVVGLIAAALSRALKLVSLGWLDRLAGGILGFLMAAMVVGLLLLLAVMAGFDDSDAIVESTLAPRVFRVTDAIVSMIPGDARESFEDGYLKLRLKWDRAQSRRERLVQSVGWAPTTSSARPASEGTSI